MSENMASPTVRDQALDSLNVLVGTWNVAGETQGQLRFEWLEGERFLVQHVDLDAFAGVEIIGYDDDNACLRSHFFSSEGSVVHYVYEITDQSLWIEIDSGARKGEFLGDFTDDFNTIVGSWEWTENGRAIGYDATVTRVRS